ncbi:hypothetical protein ABZP36_022579 [Zizania latifolia]
MGPTKKANGSGGFAAFLLSAMFLYPSFTPIQIKRICDNTPISWCAKETGAGSPGNYLIKDQIPRAPDAEKLFQLTVGSNRAPVLASDKARSPLGARAWHAPADPFRRSYEMPGERAFLHRKLVS